LIHTFVDLGLSPMANRYLAVADLAEPEPLYPLHAFVCHRCFLVQLEEFQRPAEIFSDYAYFSSYSDSWVEHARNYAEMVVKRFTLGRTTQVLEIASNDGYLIQHFVARGVPSVGIEPARNLAKVAIERGIPTLVAFFGETTARRLRETGFGADLLVGNNVLAHVPDLNDFVKGMAVILRPQGVITMELPHLLRLMDEGQFDTIYHEHFSYFSLLTAERVFARHGLRVFDVEELPTHGGSIRIFACHAGNASRPTEGRVAQLKHREEAAGLSSIDRYASFGERPKLVRQNLLAFMAEARGAGKVVVGYGAPAKGNTLLNYCGIGPKLLPFTVDRNPHKQGCYLPGTHIPIHPPDRIAEAKPDHVLILPWNLKDEIITQMDHVRAWGGRFVIPIPEVTILA
jgi:2-polyprenyl-3-methyl-5-hydroxy-6-metoxy-1,4-benzoquinol methylase